MKKAASNSVNAGNPTHAPTSENAGQTAASDANITSEEKAVKSVTAAEAERGRLEITAGNDKMRLYVQESRRGGYMAAAAQEGAAPVIFEGETREDAARQAVEYAKGEQNGGQGTRTGGERTVGLGAEGSAEGLAGEAGSDQSGTEQGRRIEKINALGLQQDSAAAQGVKNGTDTVKNRFFRPGDSEAVDKLIREDAEYSTVAALCKARGQNLILFTGLLEVNVGGKIILADGMQQGSDIYIRADGNEHSPLKIYEHEDTHDAIEAAGGENGALYKSMKARLIRNLGGEEQFEELKAKYAEALPDGYSEYQIVQEMLSDARGTMNDFKGNKALKAALDEEVQQQIGERRTGTRGSGNNLSELSTDEDTESRRKQENFADMKQAVREVLQELGIGSQETQNAGDIAEYTRSGKKPDTVHLSSNGLDADTESGYDDLSKKAEENLARVKEGLRNAEQQGTNGAGKKKWDISMGALERAFRDRSIDTDETRTAYGKAIRAVGGYQRETVDPENGITALVVQQEFYTTEMLRASRATKNAGANVTYYIGQMYKPDGEPVLGLELPGTNNAFVQVDAINGKDKGVKQDGHDIGYYLGISSVSRLTRHERIHELKDNGLLKAAEKAREFIQFLSKKEGPFARDLALLNKWYQRNLPQKGYGRDEYFAEIACDYYAGSLRIDNKNLRKKMQEYVDSIDALIPDARIGKNLYSQLGVDTDTEAAVSAEEIEHNRNTQQTSQEPLQDTGITDNRFTEALKKIGVNNITGSLVDYAGIEVEQQTARTAAEARRYLRRVLRETRADPRTQAFAHDVARGIYTIIKRLRMLLPYFVEFAKKTGLLTLVCF